jgi:hypothetical protein
MRHLIALALAVVASSACAEGTIASRMVPAPTPGQVLILELSDFQAEPDTCREGTFMARIKLAEPFVSGTNHQINMGCWHYSAAGTVIYDGWNAVTNKKIHMDMPVDDFTTTDTFKTWESYADN